MVNSYVWSRLFAHPILTTKQFDWQLHVRLVGQGVLLDFWENDHTPAMDGLKSTWYFSKFCEILWIWKVLEKFEINKEKSECSCTKESL